MRIEARQRHKLFPQFKKLDRGNRYVMYDAYTTRREANKRADRLRETGIFEKSRTGQVNVRIVMIKDFYVLYLRLK